MKCSQPPPNKPRCSSDSILNVSFESEVARYPQPQILLDLYGLGVDDGEWSDSKVVDWKNQAREAAPAVFTKLYPNDPNPWT